jgi:hypothetical protein
MVSPDQTGRPAARRLIGAAAPRRNQAVAHLARGAGKVAARRRVRVPRYAG